MVRGVRLDRRDPAAGLVVLVESHDDTRALYAEYLRAHQFNVHTAATTDEALPLIIDAAVIVTGIGVRGSFDGLALVERVRTNRATATVPIIVVTAHAMEDDRTRALGAGASAFLVKPCAPATLMVEIVRWLRRRRVGRATPTAASSLQLRRARHLFDVGRQRR